ncbi:67329e6b-8700-4f25-9b4a-ad0761ccae23-CDS [Sclerotinia trifoliorum]|uniref:67329e6b-8700-4f25-9b4a-ad0761ccae23-CDS n=1 Tax=Sclerotinia trifoliorum TaxID=28548 RepID=A0A8H2VYB4_9HELO|nr:67329e6b-8700-4f25-9b4a-ad0761ccae23-CDS [Sclerotinia trifoliorum]
MENDDLPPSGRPPMASNPARPPLIRRNAQDQVPLTIEARTQAVEVLVAQASEFLQNFVTQERDRESQLQLEALEDAEVDEETIQAEHNALVAEQNQYYVQYQANRAAEAARASEGSQQFDAAAIYARVEREYAAARALPSRVERTRLEELAWSYRHLDLESMIRYMRDVQSIPRASVASSSSSARRPNTPRPDILRPDTPRPDTPHPDTRRPDTFRLVSSRIAWSTHYTKYVRFDHYYYVAPSTASRRHAVNRLVPVQEEETEEVGQRFEIIQIGTQFAENGERVLAADSEVSIEIVNF